MFAWDEIDRIEAYKIDLITFDNVCLELVAGGLSRVVDEESTEWEELTRELTARFALRPDWFGDVAAPAFATNRTILWDRRAAAAMQRLDVERLRDAARADFEPDGALRDFYVHDATIDEWNTMLAFARGHCDSVTVTSRGKPLLHDLEPRHFGGAKRALIEIRTDGLLITGHCFTESEIELSFMPDVVSLGALLRFAAGTAAVLVRGASITPENLPADPIFAISAEGDVVFVSGAPMAR